MCIRDSSRITSPLSVLAYHPTQCSLFAEGSPAILVADPVLVRHPLMRAVKLLHEFFDPAALHCQFIDPPFDGLSAGALKAIWVHCVERHSLNGHANELTDE